MMGTCQVKECCRETVDGPLSRLSRNISAVVCGAKRTSIPTRERFVTRRFQYLVIVAFAMVLITGCTHRSAPTDPFDHELMNESSVAMPVPAHGEVAQVVSGLESFGFFCAQVRANDESAQVWCRAEVDPVDNAVDRSVTVVNIVTTREGSVQYADVSTPRGSKDSAGKRLREVLDASFLNLWPNDTSKLDKVISEVVRGPGMFPSDPHPPVTKKFNTSNASYLVGEAWSGLTFSLITSAAKDRSWPYTSDGFATTMAAAGPVLKVGGFECFPGWTSPCRMQGAGHENQQINYTTPNPHFSLDNPDQIITVDMFIPGTGESADVHDLASVGFPHGLPFLVSQARAPVEQQIVAARRTGKPFTGIVAGTILIIETPLKYASGWHGPQPVNVTIGVPPIDIID